MSGQGCAISRIHTALTTFIPRTIGAVNGLEEMRFFLIHCPVFTQIRVELGQTSFSAVPLNFKKQIQYKIILLDDLFPRMIKEIA